jgi:pimeloyl-ACP methyl ester carboxylesterase
VSVPRVDLSVQLPETAGTGVPLVLLHAFPLSSAMWNHVVPELVGVAHVVLVDLPGLGGSPVPDGDPSLDVSADGVVGVLDRLGLRRAVFAGVSMGGYVAMALARRNPDRVAGLALVDTKAEADAGEARANRLRMAEAVEGDTGNRALVPMLDTLLGPTTHARRPAVVDAVRTWLVQAPPAGVAWSQRAMAVRSDSAEVLAGLAVPAVVVVGEEDGLTPPGAAHAMADVLPDAVLTVIPGAGHLSPLEVPQEVARALIGLVVRCRIGAPSGAHRSGSSTPR